MGTKSKRLYQDIINRLNKTKNHKINIFTLGYIQDSTKKYPFQKIVLGDCNRKRMLITGGIHGNEPSGVETICSFLENSKYKPFMNEWEITFIPCINPYGYEHNTRENQDNKDLNRLFKDKHPPLEVQLIKSIFKPYYFDATIELHEDIDSYGYYLYYKSILPNENVIGLNIIKAVEKIIPINLNKSIDNMPAKNGVIERIKNINQMEWWPMAGYSLHMKSGHCLTLETPTRLRIARRVNAHLAALECVLNHCSQ